MPKLSFNLRAATLEDMPAVFEINKHYILNTVITFKTEVPTVEDHEANLQKVQRQNLPYIVAIAEDLTLVGYAYVSGFRSGITSGYKHTVELSLFCHPGYLYQGIGSMLLTKLLDVLSKPSENQGFVVGVRPEEVRVRHIIACMSVNTDSRDNGLGLKKYYESFGFTLNGHLKQVGHKHGRWIDTMYLQKSLW